MVVLPGNGLLCGRPVATLKRKELPVKVGRNDPCPCGSGKKYKHCCYAKDSVKHEMAPPEEEPAGSAGGDEAEETQETAHEEHIHHKDRSRFQGQIRGRTSTFKPNAARGGQRGS